MIQRKTIGTAHLTAHADKAAITYFADTETHDMTFDEFANIVKEMRSFLLKFGIRKRDRVALVAENHAKWLPVFIAVASYGAIAVPLDVQASNERLLSVLNDAKPRLIIVSKALEERLLLNFGNFSFPTIITNFYGDLLLARGDILPELSPPQPPAPDDPALVIYTSGTLGEPKGITLSHGAIMQAVEHSIKIGRIAREDTMMTLLPYTHVYGLVNAALVPYYTGVRNVLAPNLNPLEILTIIGYCKVTYVCFVPRLAEVFLQILKGTGRRADGLTIQIGGAHCKHEVIEALRALGAKVAFGYGMTETCGGVCTSFDGPPNSVGRAVAPVAFRLDNPVDGVGELLVSSPTNLSGVWGRPELMRQYWDGAFLRTGDMARIDADGWLTIMGRSKEVIVPAGGMNVYPDELEERLGALPFLREFSVVGLAEEEGEIPVLVARVNEEYLLKNSIGDPVEFVEREVARITHRWPEWERFRRIVHVSDPLPRTNSFKVQRKRVVEMVHQIRETERIEADACVRGDRDLVVQIFERFRPLIAAQLNMPEEELQIGKPLSRYNRLDSLGKLSLLAWFQHHLKLEIGEPTARDFESFFTLIEMLLRTNPPEKLAGSDVEGALHDLPIPVPLDYSAAGIARRREFLTQATGADLSPLERLDYADSENLQGNIENLFGFVQIPLGVVGPLRVNGDHAAGEFYVPMATTEGALVASVARGAQALTVSGGAFTKIVREGVHRTPVFVFDSLDEMADFGAWTRNNFDAIREVAESTTRHGKLLSIEQYPVGSNLLLRFTYSTGDASGQNMVTIATHKAIHFMKQKFGGTIRDLFLEGNLSGDKKANAINFATCRGRRVIAQAFLPEETIRTYLKSGSERMQRLFDLSTLGALQAHAFGTQAHFSNPLTAIYLACGQDPACAAESAVGITHFERKSDGLSVSVTLPGVMVGTVGGGTGLPTQNACLQVLGCVGEHGAAKMAEIVAATVLAAEISIAASMAADDFASAHATYGRKRG